MGLTTFQTDSQKTVGCVEAKNGHVLTLAVVSTIEFAAHKTL